MTTQEVLRHAAKLATDPTLRELCAEHATILEALALDGVVIRAALATGNGTPPTRSQGAGFLKALARARVLAEDSPG